MHVVCKDCLDMQKEPSYRIVTVATNKNCTKHAYLMTIN